ncbi:MAG: hypothetical protein ABIR67_11525 [Gaiellaceae bacterium]
MDPRQERLTRNEALFRDTNESVRAIAAAHGDDDHVYEFYCECSNANCTFQLQATLAEYEAVRAHPQRFLIRPEHVLPEIETVVQQNANWWVVEKQGEAGELAEDLDARSD